MKMEMSVESAQRRSIEKVLNWLSSEVNMSKTHVFFRSFAPVHFRYVSLLFLIFMLPQLRKYWPHLLSSAFKIIINGFTSLINPQF